MKQLALKEPSAPYTVTLDNDILKDEAMLIDSNGKPLGIIIPMDEYNAYKEWRASHSSDALPASNSLAREKQAFEQLKPELLKQHHGKPIAIRGEKLIEIGSSGESLADFAVRVYRQFGYEPVYFDVIEEAAPRTYKFPYFKVRQ